MVFRTNNGNPVAPSTFREMMLKIVGNINFDRKLECEENQKTYEEFEHIGMHTLRHSFATRCIENGMSPKALQKIMGHSNLSITLDLYVHVTDDFIVQEIEKMNVAV